MIQDLLSYVDTHLRVVFIRHSLDSGTVEGEVVRELCDVGVEEAEKCGEFLKPYSFTELYSSDHLRAQQTLGIIDLSLEKEILISRKLREVRPFYAMGDIELIKEHGEPVIDFFRGILDKNPSGSTVLAVSHSHLIRYILSLRSVNDLSLESRSINDLKGDGLIDSNSSMIEILNSSITIVDLTKSGLLIPRLVNYTEHI